MDGDPGEEGKHDNHGESAPAPDWSGYIDGLRRRIAREQAELERRHERAWQDARTLAKVLADEFGVRRVYLFGSVASPHIHARSDIDLAVEGLAPEIYFRAWARLDHETDIPIDLIDMADAPPSLIARIQKEGVIIYDRQ